MPVSAYRTASIAPIKKLLKSQERRFTKFHGRLPRASPDLPVVVYVHASKAHAEKVYERAAKSDGDFTLELDGVQITNLDGPAINVQAHQEITVELAAGTTSTSMPASSCWRNSARLGRPVRWSWISMLSPRP